MKRVWICLIHLVVLALLAACTSTTNPTPAASSAPAANPSTDAYPLPTSPASTDAYPPAVPNAPSPTDVPATNAPSAELVVEKPAAGKATITGRILSSQTKTPLAQTAVRLAEVYRDGEDGAFVLDGASSPGTISNERGEFVIANVDAKEYVIVAGDPYASNDVVKNPDGKPKAWMLTTDQILDVGTVEFNLQP